QHSVPCLPAIPLASYYNEPCVRQCPNSKCPDSEVVISPSPVVVTLPGAILSNFPQHSEVAAVGALCSELVSEAHSVWEDCTAMEAITEDCMV
uniref:Keratin n=1 Tax=Chelonoidis abingdonii TaxID=106734 RepID=A0A8C0JBJ9_CHEAB